MNVPLSCPDITDLEVEYVTRVLRSGQLSLGTRVVEFEEKFAAYVGARYAVAVNSGTSALHLAVRALGIGGGDEVITTANTFFATAEAIWIAGGKVVFVDSDPRTHNIDPARIAAAPPEPPFMEIPPGVSNEVAGQTVPYELMTL